MKTKRPLAPGFLNNLDSHLLLNKPDTWTARTHLLVYYAILFMAILAAICFIIPDDPRISSTVYVWVVWVSIIAFIGFIFWIIYLLRFNVFKRYGNLGEGDRLKTFLLYFIAIGALVLTPYVPPVVESVRANRQYSSDEIVKDVNAINLKLVTLEYRSIQLKWKADTCRVTDSIIRERPEYDDEAVYETEAAPDTDYRIVREYRLIDTAQLNRSIQQGDSLKKINDSVVVLFECPDYQFANTAASWHAKEEYLDSKDIFNRVLKNYHRPAKGEDLQLYKLINKYNPEFIDPLQYKSRYDYSFDRNDDYRGRLDKKYGLYRLNRNIDNITERKFRFYGSDLNVYVRIFLYTTLALTLLVFIFRHSTVRTFFLSILSAIIISILTGLFISGFRVDEIAFFSVCLIYYIIFLLVALTGIRSRARSLVAGISLNLAVATTFFVPLTIVALYYEVLKEKHRYEVPYPYHLFKKEYLHLLYAEIIGFVLLLLLIELIFRRAYRLWYAAPEE